MEVDKKSLAVKAEIQQRSEAIGVAANFECRKYG